MQKLRSYIFRDCNAVTGLSESILEELPKQKSIIKTFQNQRTQSFPKVPDNLKGLKIEGMYIHF